MTDLFKQIVEVVRNNPKKEDQLKAIYKLLDDA